MVKKNVLINPAAVKVKQEKDKKEKSAAFTKDEEILLVDLVLKRKDVLENQQSDALTLREKNDGWDLLTDDFNAISTNVVNKAWLCRKFFLYFQLFSVFLYKNVCRLVRWTHYA